MITSILIMAVSVAAFAYWFRYTCILILSTRTTRDYAADVAAANRLSFAGVRDLLESQQAADLEAMRQSLERDFRVVSSLMERAGKVQVGDVALEEMLLRLDFHLMRLSYAAARRFSEARSRAALVEMSQIVEHFANAFGERMAEAAQA
jgi:hypothetical protein